MNGQTVELSGTWLPLLVRLEDYAELAELVRERESTRDPGSAPSIGAQAAMDASAEPLTHEQAKLAEHVPWSVHNLARLAKGDSLTAQRWVKAMDVLAQQPGTWLPTSKVAELSGMTINEWRDAPRKMPRHQAKNYPDEQMWPLCAGGAGIVNNQGEVWWAMTEEVARRWNSVRTEQAGAPEHGGATS